MNTNSYMYMSVFSVKRTKARKRFVEFSHYVTMGLRNKILIMLFHLFHLNVLCMVTYKINS